MIVFFGTAKQMAEYIIERGLDPKNVVHALQGERAVQGFRGHIDVVVAGNFSGYNGFNTETLWKYIDFINSINETRNKAA